MMTAGWVISLGSSGRRVMMVRGSSDVLAGR